MHDANGTELKKGDTVLITAVITDLSPYEDYCNVSLKTTLGRRPDGTRETIGGINTAVLVKLASAPVVAAIPTEPVACCSGACPPRSSNG